ncbi:MAG: division/cell wall cluster transcriptional repressor MraZ [Gammaproteobacteria bacterium]
MFRGINAINLDPKGRLAMPTRYRERLQGCLVLTIDTESPCLLLYPMTEWEIIEKKIEALPSFNRVTRRIQRLLIGHATEVELDGNGRLLVPPPLRDYATLEKELMLVGQGKKFEIWSAPQWQRDRDHWLAEEAARGNEELPSELQSLAL